MQKILVFWRDIPAQVIIKSGRARGKAMLADLYQEAIDRAAMRAGKGGSDAYMSEWRRDTTSFEAEGDLNELAAAAALELEAQYPAEKIKQMVKNFGYTEMPADKQKPASPKEEG